VHCFATPLTLTYEKRYGGCRSWVQLSKMATTPVSAPVLTEATYHQRVNELVTAIAPVTASAVSLP
jgi:hypothetical protein